MKLKPQDLLSLEEYDSERESIKKELISHKKNRTINIGDNIVLIFEDFMTIKYQVQEMLRIEKNFSIDTLEILQSYGYEIEDSKTMGSTQSIYISSKGNEGFSDLRRPNAGVAIQID